MALIVEDGSIVANANSYADLIAIKAYALARGVTLGTDAVIENQAIKAMDYIEGKRNQYQGMKVDSTQSLQFPRYYLVIDGNEFAYNAIPKELIYAQCQLVIDQKNGVDIMPTINSAPIKKEKVDVIEVEYAIANGDIFQPVLSSADSLLEVLFKNTASGSFTLSTIRV